MIETMRDVEDYLRDYYVSSGSPKIGTNYRLEDTFELAKRVGSPHERLRVVHVAGTSGKTSTAYYIAALLKSAGVSVGLTVSPHISSVAERAQVNGEVLDDSQYVELFREYIAAAVEQDGLKPSYFELMLVFALWVFDRLALDYVVLETGMGGTFDSSNICRAQDKVCIITDIGYDHVHLLGDTIEQIAAQKAGIIAEQNLVCMYEQELDAMKAVREAVGRHHADLRISPNEDLAATYMERNFGLALFAYKQIAERDSLPSLEESVIDDAKNTSVPGRLEKIKWHSTTYLLDGAHNEQKMRTLFATLDVQYPDKKWPIVIALKHDKDIRKVISLIVAHADGIVVSEYEKSQDMPIAALPASELAELFAGQDMDVRVEPDLAKAVRSMESRAPEILLTGSLYAVSEARAWLMAHGGEVQ